MQQVQAQQSRAMMGGFLMQSAMLTNNGQHFGAVGPGLMGLIEGGAGSSATASGQSLLEAPAMGQQQPGQHHSLLPQQQPQPQQQQPPPPPPPPPPAGQMVVHASHAPTDGDAALTFSELTNQIQTLTTQISQLGQGHAAVPLVQARLDRLQQLLTSRVNSGNFN